MYHSSFGSTTRKVCYSASRQLQGAADTLLIVPAGKKPSAGGSCNLIWLSTRSSTRTMIQRRYSLYCQHNPMLSTYYWGSFSIRRRSMSSESYSPPLLIPPETTQETLWSAMRGVWSIVSDQTARDFYQDAVQRGIIHKNVLEHASHGAILTFALVHHLRNPLWDQYKIRLQDFIEDVGPALENFHDTVGRLRNELPELLEKERLGNLADWTDSTTVKSTSSDGSTSSANSGATDEQAKDLTSSTSTLGVNRWKQQAEADPESLAGRLSKMTTPYCMDAFYYTSKLDAMARQELMEEAATSKDTEWVAYRQRYVPGTYKVGEVALLSARAMAMDASMEAGATTDTTEQMEVTATSSSSGDGDNASEQSKINATSAKVSNDRLPVTAQVNVLYEVTHTYEKMPFDGSSSQLSPALPSSEQDNNATGENTSTTNIESDTDSKSNSAQPRVYSYTSLAVAVFESLLHSGPDTDFRWKLAMLRDAVEFPDHEAKLTRLS